MTSLDPLGVMYYKASQVHDGLHVLDDDASYAVLLADVFRAIVPPQVVPRGHREFYKFNLEL